MGDEIDWLIYIRVLEGGQSLGISIWLFVVVVVVVVVLLFLSPHILSPFT